MPGDLNDVVRHVILRVLVDADTLGAELAKARAQLKGLEDSERESNKRREKAFEGVTKAANAYTDALKDNQAVSDRTAGTAEKSAKATAEAHKESARAVKEETKALADKGAAEARTAEIEERTRQMRLRKDAERKRYNQDTATQEQKNELLLAGLRERLDAEQAQRTSEAAKKGQEYTRNQKAARERDNAESEAQVAKAMAMVRKLADQADAIRRKADNDRKIDRAESEADIQKTLAAARKLADQADAIRRKADNDRKLKRQESDAGVSRRERTTDASISRADTNAEEARVVARERSNAAITRADAITGQRIFNTQRVVDEKLTELRSRNADEQQKRSLTFADQIRTALQKGADARAISQSNVGVAQAREELATTRALAAVDEVRDKASSRRAKSTFDALQGSERLRASGTQNLILEQRLLQNAERVTATRTQALILEQRLGQAAAVRAAAEERASRAAERPARRMPAERTRRGLGTFLENVGRRPRSIDLDSDAREGVRGRFERNEQMLGARGLAGDLASLRTNVLTNLRLEAAKLAEVFPRVRNAVRETNGELRRLGGGRSGAVGTVLAGVSEIGDKFASGTGPFLRFLTSFRGAIVVLLTALGPLAAVLGSVGAAALGLASNFVALSGSLLALPGLIGAAVAGFGALGVVLGPLTNVFSAFSAAQKAATSGLAGGGKAAKEAANALQDAQRTLQDAQRAYDRAIEDQPRAERRLSDARKQAARDIQDYRLALQKLRFDQESAELGVESAEQAYRRALADPTANNLDRKIARNDVQGALFEQRDQRVSGDRLIEDANEAERRGVEGSDAVVSAKRAIEDASRSLEDATIRLRRAREDLTESEKDYAAGGPAVRKAQDQLKAQLDGLGPDTRKVVVAILALNAAWKAMQGRVSEAMFGPLSDDTEKFADVLKILETFLTPAAEAIGYLAHEALTLFTNPEWKAFFSTQGEASGRIIRDLGDAALSAANGFKSIVEVARPFTDFVVGGIKGMAESFDAFANSEDGRNAVAAFLNITKQRMSELKPVVVALFDGFVGFFKALNGFGGEDFTGKINDGLLGIALRFKELGEQAAEPNSGFRKWLKDVGPLIKDTAGFVGDLGRFFADLFKDPRNIQEARDIFASMKRFLDSFSVVLAELAESGLISQLLSGLASLTDAFKHMLDNGGTSTINVFGHLIEMTGKVIDKITELIDVVPGLGTALSVLGAVMAGLVGGALFLKFTGLAALLKGIAFSIDSMRGGKGLGGLRESLTDKLFGRDTGKAAANRAGAGATASQQTTGGVLPSLYRMEQHLVTIIRLLGGRPGPGGASTRTNPNGPDSDDDRRRRNTTAVDTDATRERVTGRTVRPKRQYGRGIGGAVGGGALLSTLFPSGDAGSFSPDFGLGRDNDSARVERSTGRDIRPKRTYGGDPADATRASTGGASSGRLAGGLARGVAGGVGGLVAGAALALGGDYAINKFVRNDQDAGSARRGLGAVATGAGIGATIGSIVPGVGTAIGGVVGGLAGGAYSLYKDKNLRSFVGDKLGTAGRAVGGALSSAGSAIGSVFTGKDADGKEVSVGDRIKTAAGALTGPVGVLASKLDVGKKIVDSLRGAGREISEFFTRTIPNFFTRGVIRPIQKFFTQTLPELPGKAFDAITTGLGIAFGFLTKTAPRIAREFFTETLPDFASRAWEGVKTNLFEPIGRFITEDIPGFFTNTIPRWFNQSVEFFRTDVIEPMTRFITETVPNFFTQTIPRWFEQAPEFFRKQIIEPIGNFFTVTLPEFFTVTLPEAIRTLPGVVYNNLVQPVLDFFGGIKDHVGDFLKGSFDWARNLFERGSRNFEQGSESVSMSGGLVKGVYQGIEDNQRYRLTPEEFVVRRGAVVQPGGKQFLREFNEGRITPADYYAGLAAAAAPQVMSIVPPNAPTISSGVTNTTVDNSSRQNGFQVGDITINNPVREPSDRSMRRALQVASIRHRR